MRLSFLSEPFSKLKAAPTLLWVALVIPSGRPSIEIQGFKMVEAKEENRLLELKARNARFYKLEEVFALDQLEAQIHAKSKKPFQVSGNLGILDSNTQDFQIYQKAEVITPDAYQFRTTNLLYLQKQRSLQTDEAVEAEPVKSKRASPFRVSGKGLKIELDKNTYEILRNARTEQKLSRGTFQIRAQSALFEPDQNLATFLKSVSVKSPTLELKGERLIIEFSNLSDPSDNQDPQAESASFQPKTLTLDSPHPLSEKRFAPRLIKAKIANLKLESKGLLIELNPDGSVLQSRAIGNVDGITENGVKLKASTLISDIFEGKERILLKDDVEIVTNSRVAHCQDAQYFPESGNIILERVASVKTDEQTLEGERILFSTMHSEIVVEKARGSLDKGSLMKKEK